MSYPGATLVSKGALANLRYEIGRSTIAKVLKEAGLDPAPERRKGTTWNEFLRIHWDTLAAADFFTVEVWTPVGLVRYHVLFVIPEFAQFPSNGALHCRQRLGGLLRYYFREAA